MNDRVGREGVSESVRDELRERVTEGVSEKGRE